MPIIHWSNAYSVGHGEIDKQHRRIFDIINQLYDAVQNGNGMEIARQLADDIISHAAEHFALEEKLMAAASYPGLEEHREQHEKVLSKAAEYCEALLEGSQGAAVRLLNFLKDWILDHLSGWDREYIPYIAEKQ